MGLIELGMDAHVINKYKLIYAFLSKENINYNKADYYFNLPFAELKDIIQKRYDVKILDWKHMQKAKKITDIPSEYEEQKKLVKWLRDNKIPCQSSGNGFKLATNDNIHYVAKLKASGLSVGFPDLEVFIGNGTSLFIEMKRVKGGVVSEAQERWIDWLDNNGYKAKVCYGANEAIEFVKENIEELRKKVINEI